MHPLLTLKTELKQKAMLFCCVPGGISRERERELYGPKKRGPKPKTFLLKARAQAEALHIGDVHFSVKPGSSTSSPKLHSSAAVHRLKKDIRRCHRMSRRPLPRPDPQNGGSVGGGAGIRPPVSPFSETVRIINRKVKPREPKRSRIILNLKQELPARTNGSAPTTPALARDALHTKMEQLEEQLLSKILTLQKERQAASTHPSQQQHDIEKELNSLQNRVMELEHGESCYSPPNAFKVTIPVQNNYMYARMKKSLPELYAFTICMWLKSKALAGLGTPFSYSVPSQANEIVLLEWGTNPLELLINDKVAQLPLSLKDKAWHHVCVAWTTRDGKWSAYQDGEQRGAGENLASWHAIKPQGVIILGQEQDTLGGRFDATQAFVGELEDLAVSTGVSALRLPRCKRPMLAERRKEKESAQETASSPYLFNRRNCLSCSSPRKPPPARGAAPGGLPPSVAPKLGVEVAPLQEAGASQAAALSCGGCGGNVYTSHGPLCESR
ncbi:PREDICTED: neuronal pentraxin receptor-like [Pygoscelis adeliae]|uniref:neuronal pentraxin receptor-like n=1 Tax=Pygoscelis adeliae TaxID=9238 RepID=UPI0004F4F5E6|nr:PREDICTED: neuronal pentraxin receptor-like [Pygoscelis adeliae]